MAMREADVAIRLRQPTQPDLIQRKLFSVRFHAYASPEYLKRFGTRVRWMIWMATNFVSAGANSTTFGESTLADRNRAQWQRPAHSHMLTINNVLGVLRACQRGIGIAFLPDYLVEENGGWCKLFGDSDSIALDAYFVYPEELKSVARVQVFRDFLVRRRSAGTFDAPEQYRMAALSSHGSIVVRARNPHGWHAQVPIAAARSALHNQLG